VNPRLKRALWCRWFHRWHMPRHPAPPVVSRDPSESGQTLRLSAGPHRNCCDACTGEPFENRTYRKWLAS
jgi:hypothetical protein